MLKLSRHIESNSTDPFDIIIIGGGITGAAVAYTASSMGYKTALFEKNDYGGATSAATSKLIHGGLRYLANFELGLVRESLRERLILGNIAPNFVYPLPFLFPIYGGIFNILKMQVGLNLYDILSFDKSKTWDKSKALQNHTSYNSIETTKIEPNIVTENLQQSLLFYDYQSIAPERLTLAFLKSAVQKGAVISNYAKVESFIQNQNRIEGVVVRDLIHQTEKEFKAKIIVNCAGTWADEILKKVSEQSSTAHKVKRSEGIHIITKKIAENHVVSLQTKSGKHLMIMPWRNHSIIGTTDKEYLGEPDQYKVSKQGIDELLTEVNEHYKVKLTYADVQFAYGGLRPLIDNPSENSYNASRKFELYDHAKVNLNGLITVEGGKYTTSRHLAHEVLKLIQKKWQVTMQKDKTAKNYLYGCEIPNVTQFLTSQHQKYDAHFNPKTVEYISKNYGTQSDIIFQLAQENEAWKEQLTDDGEILAEVVYAIQFESTKTLCDILLRRTGIGTLGKPTPEIIDKITDLTSKMLHWSTEETTRNQQQIQNYYTMPFENVN